MKCLLILSFALFTFLRGFEAWFLSPPEECYKMREISLGCFNRDPPFDDLPLPDKFQPEYHLFTRARNDETNTTRLDLDVDMPAEFDPTLPIKIIIHGYLQSWYAEWMHKMKEELLTNGDYNVILVDWRKGAQTLNYKQAASNVRFSSAYLAKFLEIKSAETGFNMSQVHCIGHSLGAQTCGFTGARVNPRIARVTGLDPAGPNFRDKPKEGRLDKDDADFVDSIHSNGRDSFTMDLGIGHQVADVDFIPNGGGIQPGCFNRRKKRWNEIEAKLQRAFIRSHEAPSCSHGRSYEFFTESINSNCSFLAVPCPHMDVDAHDECQTCTGDECQLMGFYADTRPGRGIYYVKTADTSPYCLGAPDTWTTD